MANFIDVSMLDDKKGNLDMVNRELILFLLSFWEFRKTLRSFQVTALK